MALTRLPISSSLINKGISNIILDDERNELLIINHHDILRSKVTSNFESTINDLTNCLDMSIDDSSLKQEIIYNISKLLKQFLDDIKTLESEDKKEDKSPRIDIDISFEDWQTTLLSKYSNLHDKVFELIPELWKPLEFMLSVKTILNIKDCTLPFIGIILGPPSSVKTVTIELFRNCSNTFYTDNFSAKSFVSHNTAVSRDKLPNIDLLPKIKNSLFLTPELSPTFSKRYEELIEILGIITRIADGHGYESDTGAQGHRGYSGEYMFTWIGAAVDVPQKVHRLLGTLGPKLYFFRLYNRHNFNEENYLEKMKKGDRFKSNCDEIKEVLVEYLEWFNRCPISVAASEKDKQSIETSDGEGENNIGLKVKWDSLNDDENALRIIIRLAQLLSRFRGVIPTWETKDTQGSDYAYTFATIEEPDRAITQLKNLARGHALSKGRLSINVEDIPLVVNVVLSTASRERVVIFDHILKNNGLTDTIRIVKELNTTKPTALRTMTEFTALGIVDKIILGEDHNVGDEEGYAGSDRTNALVQVKLKPEFDWFLSDEFQSLRGSGTKQADYQAYAVNQKNENHQDIQRFLVATPVNDQENPA
jgi:hypothetical protein